jgi:tetratricopeptide (TPR) repeat protein
MERLGEQLLLVGRYDEAAERFRACIDVCELTGAGREARSRVWRRLAEAHERANRYDEALNALDSAQSVLGPEPRDDGDTWWRSWIEAELARAGIHYWRNDSARMAACQQRLEPVVEQWGDRLQRGRFQFEIVRQSLRRNRYRADAAMIARARLAVAGLDDHSARSDEAELLFGLGFAHFWADEFDDAKAAMERSLGIAHRIGSVMLKARCLTYLGLVHRRLGHEADVARINDEVREFVARSGAANYAATASAQDAWLAWRRHDSQAACSHVEQAISTWMSKSPGYPVQWPGWWVRVALAFESGDMAVSVDALRSMVAPSQARPPDDLENLVRSLVASYDANGGIPPAGMQRAVDMARAYGFL